MMKPKPKKTLLQQQQAIILETNILTLVGIRSRAAMLDAAIQLESKREGSKRYIP